MLDAIVILSGVVLLGVLCRKELLRAFRGK